MNAKSAGDKKMGKGAEGDVDALFFKALGMRWLIFDEASTASLTRPELAVGQVWYFQCKADNMPLRKAEIVELSKHTAVIKILIESFEENCRGLTERVVTDQVTWLEKLDE